MATTTSTASDAQLSAYVTSIIVEAYKDQHVAINAAYTARYLSIIGFVLLVYDHALTLRRERDLVWSAPASLSKYAFLFNRYVVPLGMLAILYQLSGYIGINLSHRQCQTIHTVAFVLAVCSVALANFMILMRVVTLWEHNKVVAAGLTGTFVVCYIAVLGLLTVAVVKILPGLQWNRVIGMCFNSTTTPFLIGVWGCAMIFELVVLGAICWNVFDRPRNTQQPIAKMLRKDGIAYFALISVCRIVNLALAATNDSRYSFVAVYFVWQMVTLLVSRMLLRLRALDKANMALPKALVRPHRSGARGSSDRDGVRSKRGSFGSRADVNGVEDWELESAGVIEVGKVELVIAER